MSDKLQEIRERLAMATQPVRRELYYTAPADIRYLLGQLERFTALEAHLPEGYAIGDDATAELAIKLVAAESRLLLAEKLAEREGVYMASKTKHADKWKALRSSGVPVICTWIDEAGVGETKDFSDLWVRCISEVGRAEVLIAYVEDGDELKGGLLEIGAALSAGTPVIVVGDVPQLKTAKHHPLVSFADSIEAALSAWEEK